MSRVIVVGSGIAGLVAAIGAAREHEVVLVTKSQLRESNTYYAQGGIAAVMFPDDSVQSHIDDTMRAGAGLSDPDAVRVLCEEGPLRVRQLIELGVAFDRDGEELARGHEAAHSHRRVLHAGGDATGAVIERGLLAALHRAGVQVLEHRFMTEILVSGGAVSGIELMDDFGAIERLAADRVVLASGGAGQLYRHTTNPAVTTGDGVAAAWRAGAQLSDVEFYQFHPTALALPGSFLVSEAVRGEGAVLLDVQGQRFMQRVHPDAELAPRDVVARGIAEQMAAQGGAPVLLDATALGADFLAQRFPSIDRAVRERGLDWSIQPIPVTPAAHYWMGGVRSDVWGRTTLPGLFAVGEVACTGVHGANRLASNSLLESLVFAWRAVGKLDASWPDWPQDEAVTELADARPAAVAIVQPALVDASAGTAARFVERRDIQELNWKLVGLHRELAGLREAAAALAAFRIAPERLGTPEGREDQNLLELSRVLAAAAIAREESRGAHERLDHPGSRDEFAHHLHWVRKVAAHVH